VHYMLPYAPPIMLQESAYARKTTYASLANPPIMKRVPTHPAKGGARVRKSPQLLHEETGDPRCRPEAERASPLPTQDLDTRPPMEMDRMSSSH
jgi:hypothetical protein